MNRNRPESVQVAVHDEEEAHQCECAQLRFVPAIQYTFQITV